jgi:hypothetical protein
MLAALSFSSVLAISLASYVAISYNTLNRVDDRVKAASQLLEGQNVLEETLYSVSSESLSSWTQDGGTATKTVTGLDLAALAEALPIDFEESVSVTKPSKAKKKANSAFSRLFARLGMRSLPEAEASADETIDPDAVELKLTGLDGSDQRTLSLTQKRKLENGSIETRVLSATMSPLAPFQNAVTAKGTIRLRRDGTVDSYDSTEGNYGGSNQGYEAMLAGNYVSVSRAQVSGYASSVRRAPYFGRRASLRGEDTNNKIRIDETRIVPTPYQPNLDTTASSGVGSLYRGPYSTLGSRNSDEPRLYYANDLNLRRNEQITVEGPTRLIVDGELRIQDSAAIIVKDGANLEIQVEGNVNIDGRGIINLSKVPSNVAVIGTNSQYRSIIFQGDEPFHGTIYAPNSSVYTYGRRSTHDIYGAIVANRVTFDSNTNLHFDVALRDAQFDGVEKAYAFDPQQ